MRARTIDGEDLRNWFLYGHREVDLHKKHINSINVFPVADCDTGTNLTMTLKAMAEWPVSTKSFSGMIERISESGLAHARGNSGLIFASYVNGLAEESKVYESVNTSQFAAIAHQATDYVYKALENPVEGTMITVIRDWASFLIKNYRSFDYFDDFMKEAYETAKLSLEKTTEKLEVLRINKVVDAGAEGFVRFLKGINNMLQQNQTEETQEAEEIIADRLALVEEGQYSKYRYCSEMLLHPSTMDLKALRAQLEPLGDSLILSSHHDKLRVHMHTDHPNKMMGILKDFGQVLEQKIDDMFLQKEILNHRVSQVALLTDSIADIPDTMILENQIHRVPLTVMIDEVPFLDRNTIDLQDLFRLMDSADTYPTSTQPEPERVREKIEYLLEQYESVIILSVAEKLSGTYGVFKREAQRLSGMGKKVTVIDSRLNSGAQGLLAAKASALLKSGLSHDDTVEQILRWIPKVKIYVCLDTIQNAVRGGRVSSTVGKFATALGARPIMTLDEEGKGKTFGMGFSRKGMTRKIFALADKIHKNKGIESYCIVHACNQELAEAYGRHITALTGKKPEFITEISAVTAIHSGPGCVALALMEN
jgi:uncharacterized protein